MIGGSRRTVVAALAGLDCDDFSVFTRSAKAKKKKKKARNNSVRK